LTSKNGFEDKVRILIVDDEDDIRIVLAKGLEAEGFSVESSGDPEEVLKTFKKGMYDLVLLDIRMPKMTGFELFREIRKIDSLVRVCFITAFEIYFDEFKKVFPKIHVSCFIRKPVTIKQLAAAIHSELARPELRQDVEEAPPSRSN
jgi:DNA-binding response OmpR family regulator